MTANDMFGKCSLPEFTGAAVCDSIGITIPSLDGELKKQMKIAPHIKAVGLIGSRTGAGAQTELFSFGGLTAVAYTTGELEVTLNGQSVGSAVGAVSDGGTNTLEVRIEEDKALHVILNGTDIGSIANANLGGQGQLVIGNTTNFGYATSFDSFTVTEGKPQQAAGRPAGAGDPPH